MVQAMSSSVSDGGGDVGNRWQHRRQVCKSKNLLWWFVTAPLYKVLLESCCSIRRALMLQLTRSAVLWGAHYLYLLACTAAMFYP